MNALASNRNGVPRGTRRRHDGQERPPPTRVRGDNAGGVRARTSLIPFSTVRHWTDWVRWRVEGKTSQKARVRTKARVRALSTTIESANGYSLKDRVSPHGSVQIEEKADQERFTRQVKELQAG